MKRLDCYDLALTVVTAHDKWRNRHDNNEGLSHAERAVREAVTTSYLDGVTAAARAALGWSDEHDLMRAIHAAESIDRGDVAGSLARIFEKHGTDPT